jgi:hypothetical protein
MGKKIFTQKKRIIEKGWKAVRAAPRWRQPANNTSRLSTEKSLCNFCVHKMFTLTSEAIAQSNESNKW